MSKEKQRLFFEKYKNILEKKYPSTSQNETLPPVSPFLVSISSSVLGKIQTVLKILYKMTHLKSYIKAIQTDQTDYLLSSMPDSALLMAYDFHVNKENELKLIEVNTQASGYLVSELVDQTQNALGALTYRKPVALESLKKSFEQEWKAFLKTSICVSSVALPPEILIVDDQIPSQKMYIEFLMYKDLFSSWGWPCRLYELQNLKEDPKSFLADEKNKKIEMVYNRSTDFYFENHPVLKKAFLKKWCLISPHPREYLLLADKRRLCDWSSKEFLSRIDLTKEEIDFLIEVVPATFSIQDFSFEELSKKKKSFFFKPFKGYGGQLVYNGKTMSQKVMKKVFETGGVLQKSISPGQIVDSEGKKWKYDIRAYCYKDILQHLTARVYQGQVTQFRTPLSGFASVVLD